MRNRAAGASPVKQTLDDAACPHENLGRHIRAEHVGERYFAQGVCDPHKDAHST